ncbi:MAG: hypothetical protein QNJ16_04370 [Rhodobacter sp.]|nr:hypothetical protein [Rhodobacter sp.]
MTNARFGVAAAVAVAVLGAAPAAHAFCTDKWADVTILCPKPVPYQGKKTLTETSRNLPVSPGPGLYRNYGWGYDVRVYAYGNGTGYQNFWWEEDTSD